MSFFISAHFSLDPSNGLDPIYSPAMIEGCDSILLCTIPEQGIRCFFNYRNFLTQLHIRAKGLIVPPLFQKAMLFILKMGLVSQNCPWLFKQHPIALHYKLHSRLPCSQLTLTLFELKVLLIYLLFGSIFLTCNIELDPKKVQIYSFYFRVPTLSNWSKKE